MRIFIFDIECPEAGWVMRVIPEMKLEFGRDEKQKTGLHGKMRLKD